MKGEDREELDDFERRLRASLHGRSDRIEASPFAYRSVLRRAERARRTRVRRRMALAGSVAVVLVAVPVGLAVFVSEPAQVVSSAPGEGSPPLLPNEVPSGFELTEVIDLDPGDGAGEVDYVQVFRPVARDGRVVARQSSLSADSFVPPADATQVDVNGSPAWLARTDGERATLTWADNQTQSVRELYGRNFSDAELVALAEALRRRIDGPGFDTAQLPVDIRAVSEGEMPVEDDEAAGSTVRFSSERPGARGMVDLVVRAGSPLELELIGVSAPMPPLDVSVDGVRRLLVTDDSSGPEEHTAYWTIDDDAIVEVSAEGLSRADLLDFVASLPSDDLDEWQSFLDAARALDVSVDAGDDPDPSGDAGAVPGYAIEGVEDGSPWRLSAPIDDPRCVTLELGATSGVHCFGDEPIEAVGFDLVEVTALVLAADVEIAEVRVGDEVVPADGVVGGVWVAWLSTDATVEQVTVEPMAGEAVVLAVVPPSGADEDGGPPVFPVDRERGAG